MAKHKMQPGRGRGRPKAENPKSITLQVRVDPVVVAALERYREAETLGDRSDAVRHILARTLKDRGMLK